MCSLNLTLQNSNLGKEILMSFKDAWSHCTSYFIDAVKQWCHSRFTYMYYSI